MTTTTTNRKPRSRKPAAPKAPKATTPKPTAPKARKPRAIKPPLTGGPYVLVDVFYMKRAELLAWMKSASILENLTDEEQFGLTRQQALTRLSNEIERASMILDEKDTPRQVGDLDAYFGLPGAPEGHWLKPTPSKV